MQLIDNWWGVIKASAAVRLGWALGVWGSLITAAQQFLSQSEQDALHVAWQVAHFPFVTAVLAIFGISAARAVKQQSVTNAANK